MDLFNGRSDRDPYAEPLASRMRPRTLDEFLGQRHVVGEGALLRRAIEADRLGSVILYGPPGTGKTTLARIIARMTRSHFEQLNAVTAGVKDIRRVAEEAQERRRLYGIRTILFIDEIHRFNKTQQDALLPYVEDGTVVLIGATTFNPMVDCVPALVSRSMLFRLEPLSEEDIATVIRRAVRDEERGLGGLRVEVEEDAVQYLARRAAGDARVALNALELAALTTEPGPDGVRRIDRSVIAQSLSAAVLRHDREGDSHYDNISAFIKSMRGSDPDATLYYLARMLYAGEDPRFIARRIIVQAAEDVGLADPNALSVAVSAAQAVEYLGMPEARIPLAEAALYVALAPKSNSAYRGISEAWRAVEEGRVGEVPDHLRDSSYRGAKRLGHGRGYKYPHDYDGHYVRQQYLPRNLLHETFYHPGELGVEAELVRRLRRLKERDKRR